MSNTDSTRPALERHDLDPDPEPTTHDVVEGISAALYAAVDLAEPRRSAARCLTLGARVNAATAGRLSADELLSCLRRLETDWRTQDGERS